MSVYEDIDLRELAGRRGWPFGLGLAPVSVTPELLEAARASRPVAYVVGHDGQTWALGETRPRPAADLGWPAYMSGVDWGTPAGGFGPSAPTRQPSPPRQRPAPLLPHTRNRYPAR